MAKSSKKGFRESVADYATLSAQIQKRIFGKRKDVANFCVGKQDIPLFRLSVVPFTGCAGKHIHGGIPLAV